MHIEVSIARAVYANADIYLLDDPLSTVDAHVNKALFDKLFGPTGKTKILVTHSVNHLPNVDYIIYKKDGCVNEQETYVDLIGVRGEVFRMMTEYSNENDENPENAFSDKPSRKDGKDVSTVDAESTLDGKSTMDDRMVFHNKSNGLLVKEEHRKKGSVMILTKLWGLSGLGSLLDVFEELLFSIRFHIFIDNNCGKR
ncbi:hypothetical protein BC936DRAFT_147323 [Jimgerdemannia flammicorona]|uniref:P-loop containing nucleoside triphosphate hydrolase protein n=1 Tax=Jimgerdemannia flammicorona TaxID=994334 RepID=A0A433DKZ1_9FUNG|nr:hypothetical protein BC936DRAFT_147323 [Jimgerdemannia flammicorona]